MCKPQETGSNQADSIPEAREAMSKYEAVVFDSGCSRIALYRSKPVYGKRVSRSARLALVGIDLYRVPERDKTEWNNPERVFGDPKSTLPALLNRSFEEKWQLLCLLDPYDDTFVDHQQFSTLLKEFHLLEEYCASEEERT